MDTDMAARTLSLARLLELAPSDRLSCLKVAARDIDLEIERLKAGEIEVWYGRSRAYHFQTLYARRQQLVALARDAGCEGWAGEPTEAS